MYLSVLTIAASLMAAPQEGSEGAEAFVRSIYALYAEDGPWPTDEARLDLVFTPRLAALIRQDRALAADEPPYLDADPICQCQDAEDLRVTGTRVSRDGQGAIIVTARFTNAGETQSTALRLSGSPIRGWRIDDVLPVGRSQTLVETLEESNQRVERGGRAVGRD